VYKQHLIFEGISVDEAGKQYYLDPHISYRRACLNAIEYMKKFGFTGEQAYAILGTAPVEGRISGIVDIPNACATLLVAHGDLQVSTSSLRADGPIPGVQPGIDLAKVI
jgi:formamidase